MEFKFSRVVNEVRSLQCSRNTEFVISSMGFEKVYPYIRSFSFPSYYFPSIFISGLKHVLKQKPYSSVRVKHLRSFLELLPSQHLDNDRLQVHV
jgi:hypothetical protein